MSRRLTDVDPHDVVAVGGVDGVESAVHLAFSAEGLDDAQAAKSLFDLTHRVAPKCLCLDGLRLQFAAYPTHEPSHDGHDDEGEEGELP